VMGLRGHAVTRHDASLRHRDSGTVITPHLLEQHPATKVVRSMTAMTMSHPRLAPNGVFEYQHAFGETLNEAVCSGFDQWVQLDFATFLDALRDRPQHSLTLEMTLPRGDGPGLNRRAVLGPVSYLVTSPQPGDADEHPFCSCCLLTNTFEAFRPVFEADGFFGIRLFAARNEDGSAQADCRVNGQDWENGKLALRNYVDRWPQAGFEFRKQYVILQTLSTPGQQ
jgi:hypothetical protein